ncbi:MAG: DUF177 domain-containing protein [Eubacteriales bacterium]|nr:DUF177 domain-containing protein [Eubacteriales bacterium]
MLVDIAQISNGLTNRIDLEMIIAQEEWAVSFQAFKLAGDASFSGMLLADENGVINITGHLNAHIVSQCARCLVSVPLDLVLPVDECFECIGQERQPDSDCYSYERSTIDLIPALRDTLVLSVPQRILCHETCKGICPECGVDLNKETCSCSKEGLKQDNPFSQLKELL